MSDILPGLALFLLGWILGRATYRAVTATTLKDMLRDTLNRIGPGESYYLSASICKNPRDDGGSGQDDGIDMSPLKTYRNN